MLPTLQADQAFEPSGDPDTSSGAGPRHHVVVWLFRNRYWQFEFTSLRHPVSGSRRSPGITAQNARVGQCGRSTGTGESLTCRVRPSNLLFSLWARNSVPMLRANSALGGHVAW